MNTGITDILLWCPQCHQRHIDTGEFLDKPHHTHACQHCGHCWRPAIVYTRGVQFLPGFENANLCVAHKAFYPEWAAKSACENCEKGVHTPQNFECGDWGPGEWCSECGAIHYGDSKWDVPKHLTAKGALPGLPGKRPYVPPAVRKLDSRCVNNAENSFDKGIVHVAGCTCEGEGAVIP